MFPNWSTGSHVWHPRECLTPGIYIITDRSKREVQVWSLKIMLLRRLLVILTCAVVEVRLQIIWPDSNRRSQQGTTNLFHWHQLWTIAHQVAIASSGNEFIVNWSTVAGRGDSNRCSHGKHDELLLILCIPQMRLRLMVFIMNESQVVTVTAVWQQQCWVAKWLQSSSNQAPGPQLIE
jgi:hypothetical protein